MIRTGDQIFGPKNSQYTVLEFIGSGAFGTVYKVRETQTGETCAVKTLSAPGDADLKTFFNEGQLALGIRHPNVIEYYYFHDGRQHSELPVYILMQFASGGTLAEMLSHARTEQKSFPNENLLEIFRQLIRGMAAINAKLVHRDVKPGNILIDDKTLRITDFGLAKLVSEATRALTFKGGGSFPYMAPEAWRFETNTIALDIYALGIVFYELATLRHPLNLTSDDPQKWMEAHMYQPVVSPDKVNPALGPKISQLIMKMIEKNVAQRFSDWPEIERLLDKAKPASDESQRLVEIMLQKRLEQDSAAQAAAAEAERKEKERHDFCKVVTLQVQQQVIEPLVAFVEDFNQHYSGEGISASPGLNETSALLYLSMPSGARIGFNFYVALEEAFVRSEQTHDAFGHAFQRTVVRIPKFRGDRVQGWGVLRASDDRGINILLVEQPNQIYGIWWMLINTSGFFSSERRKPEPFAFGFEELEQAVGLIDVLGQYQVKAEPFSISYIKEFIAGYV